MPEATINDLFMTTVGGALRRYLESKGELPDATLTCMVPMSFRGPDKAADLGNQIGMAVMPLHTQLHDPIDRLQEIRRGAAKAKALSEIVGRDLTARLFEVLPDAASELATRRLVQVTYDMAEYEVNENGRTFSVIFEPWGEQWYLSSL